jgi:hypothetical protein
MENYSQEQPINVGYGENLSIGDLALLIKEVDG